MATKLEMIQELLVMQRKYMDYANEYGATMQEYFAPPPGNPLVGYREKSADISRKISDVAHLEKETKK